VRVPVLRSVLSRTIRTFFSSSGSRSNTASGTRYSIPAYQCCCSALTPTDKPSVIRVPVVNHTLMQILSQMSAKVVRFDDAVRVFGIDVECTQLLMNLVDGFEACP
jgi:hypothetical protein